MKCAYLLAVTSSLGFAFAFGAVPTNLRDRIAPEDFEKAGLEKLDEAELDHLASLVAQWIENEVEEEKSKQPTAGPQGEDGFGIEAVTDRVAAIFQSNSPDRIESRLSGEFRGWSGKTVFELENGQVWRQVQAGRFVVRLRDPRVVISRAAMGSYLLQVEGYNSSVRVRRIR